MNVIDIIQKKRLGKALREDEIRDLVAGYTAGDIPDYQVSALLMAICFSGMNENETFVLTDAMMRSGDVLDMSVFGRKTVDKHSTGGVGDKTTLIIAPLTAALGAKVPKMSGRGLGHTGGTLDKLESIPGYMTALSPKDFVSTVQNCGVAVVGQTANITPADKKLYALRDVTATVDSIPLIASSVMSKKLAAGAQNIVLDVTVGSGAFLKNLSDARELAKLMVAIGKNAQRNIRAVITNMDVPLGNAVGNALELSEAADVLQGRGPLDLIEISLSLASHMVSLAESIPYDQAKAMAAQALADGRALRKFEEWISAQGGDTAFIEDRSALGKAAFTREFRVDRSGCIAHMDAQLIGRASAALGAGRQKLGDFIDPNAGIVLTKKTGDFCRSGDVIALLHTADESLFENAQHLLARSLQFSEEKPAELPLIYDVIE